MHAWRILVYQKIKSGECNHNNVTSLEKHSSALQWLAPEVLLDDGNKRAFSQQSDIYSYGIIVWEVFTQKSPYDNLSQGQIAQKSH